MKEIDELIKKLRVELTDEIMERVVKPIIQQTREDTLRQVLPEKGQNSLGYGLGYDTCIDDIQNKAKEIWGIDLTN